MGIDIKLVDEKGMVCQIKRQKERETTNAELNITYNYSWFWYKFLDTEKGMHFVDGKKAKECISTFEKCIEELTTPKCFGNGENPDKNYWKPTPGNACKTLKVLLEWAKQHPEAKFKTY